MISWFLISAALAAAEVPAPAEPAATSEPAAPAPAAPTPAPQAQTPPARAADPLALLATAMNPALAPAERAAALEALGRAGDERVLPSLAYLARDRAPQVRLAAVKAIGAFASDDAQRWLLESARDSQLSTDAREEAVRAVAAQGRPSAADRLAELKSDPKLTPSVARAAESELRTRFPERLPPESVPAQALRSPRRDTSGQLLLAVGGGVYGGYSLYAVGQLGKDRDTASTIGLLGGAVLGATGGYLLGPDYTPSRSLYLFTGTGLGLYSGLALGFAAGLDPDDRGIHLAALGGELAGAGLSLLLWDKLEPIAGLERDQRTGGENQLAIGTALYGATALHLVSLLPSPDADGLQTWAALSGVVLGGAAGNLFGRTLTPPQGGYYSTGTAWGLGIGLMSSFAVERNPLQEESEGAMLLGGALGAGAAALTFDPKLSGGDVVTINLAAATGLALGTGFILLPEPRDDDRPAFAVMAAATTASLVGGRLVTEHLRFDAGDRALVGLGTAHGLAFGAIVPDAFSPTAPDRHHGAGALIGSAVGTLAAGAVAQFTDYRPRDVLVMTLADGFGHALGGGIGSYFDDKNPRNIPIGLLTGGLLTLGAASQLAPHMQLDAGDGVLLGFGSLTGLFNGLALANAAEARDDVVLGNALVGLGTAGLGSLAIAQFVDKKPLWWVAAFSGGAWGLWLAGWSIELQGSDRPENALIAAGSFDAGLALATVLLTQGAAPRQLGITAIGGVGGAVIATLGTAMATRDEDALITANLIGTGVGLAGGAVVAYLVGPGKPETANAPGDAEGSGRAGGPKLSFKGFTSQPVIGRTGKIDGFALAAVIEER